MSASEIGLLDVPDVPLDRIFEYFLAATPKNTSDNYMWFLDCNQVLNPHYSKMVARVAQKSILIFRLVCRKFREIANRRAIPVDLLLNNCDARFISRKTILYPFMSSALRLPYQKFASKEYWEDYRSNVNANVPPADWLAGDWTQMPRVSLRLVASNFSLLTKVNPEAFAGRISEVHVGTTRSRAIHVWAETGFEFLKRLGVQRLCVGALRISASVGMRLLSSGKNAASLDDMKAAFHLTCRKLIYVMESSYAGDGSDLSVQVPIATHGIIMTSGINSIQYHNRKYFFGKNWRFDALPGPGVSERGYFNIRTTEELALQYIFIDDFDKLMEFFPRLKRVTLYRGCYLRPALISRNLTHAMLANLLVDRFMQVGVSVTVSNYTAFVY